MTNEHIESPPEKECCKECKDLCAFMTRTPNNMICVCHTPPTPDTVEKWKEQFVKRFPNTPPEDFFVFIEEVLHSQAEEIKRWAEKEYEGQTRLESHLISEGTFDKTSKGMIIARKNTLSDLIKHLKETYLK